jgi:hypothetical protein
MKDLEGQRVCMKFCLKLAKTFTETFQMFEGDKCYSVVSLSINVLKRKFGCFLDSPRIVFFLINVGIFNTFY